MNNRIRSHVEAHAAATMHRRRDRSDPPYESDALRPGATGCDAMLPRMLPEGAKLTARPSRSGASGRDAACREPQAVERRQQAGK